MHAYGIEDFSGLYIYKSPKYAQYERICKLVQIAVEQSEENAGKEDRYFFSVFYGTVYEQFTEDQFFQNRGAQHHNKKCSPGIDICNNIRQRIVHRRTLDYADDKRQPQSDQIAQVHHGITDEKRSQPLHKCHTVLFHRDRWYLTDQQHHQRHGDQIHREHSNDKPDIRIVNTDKGKLHNKESRGILYSKNEQRP